GMTAEMQKALKGMDYPASKQELMQQAKQNKASRDVINAIENLPEDKFNSPVDVQKAWGQEKR
ncbi:MAG: DUF2795 domain-containing protein, partial [Methanobacterium sp.]